MTRTTFYNILNLLFLGILSMSGFISAEASPNYPFAQSSVLSSGDWVKVRVPETGIYEISYKQLREMGFSDPSKVGVYGKGGTALPLSFTDGTDPCITDDLKPVGVWHHDDKIFFYGRSTEDITFNASTSQFVRNSLNIYSLDGVYFLSDSGDPKIINQIEKPEKASTPYYLGFDYVYHENDLHQNTTETGQIFWGEDLLESPDGFKWNFNLPLLDINAKARLECKVFAADKSSGSFRYGATQATAGNRTFNIKHPAAASGNKINPEFLHMSNPVISLSLPTKEVEVYTKAENAHGSFINLDYWILSYSKQLPDFDLTDQSQERFIIKSKGAKPGSITIPGGENVVAFDITDKDDISLLARESLDLGTAFYFDIPDNSREFIFCDLSKKQKEISGYEPVKNSDLHGLVSTGADFLIITVPRYKDFSDRLAALHHEYGGLDVKVAVINDVYNEFSGGIPDPMAIRGIMKMCYEASDAKLKNILLVGKLHADFRKVLSEMDAEDFLIGFQDNRVTDETHAANAMDFFGFTEDVIYNSLQNNTMQVGVGLLPFFSVGEAENYLKKVERYLTDTDKASYVNEFLSIGGVGDNHTHDTQGKQLADYWTLYSPPGQNNEVLALDAYGEKEAKRQLMNNLKSGKLLTSYFGHGTSFGINSTYDFFKVNDIPTLKNDKSGFMIICACDISDTDHARKGFGEVLTTGTQHGMLGTIIATRTVWSGQNFELAKLFSSSLYASPEKVADPSKPGVMRTVYRLKTPTVGEAFARAKSLSNYTNSLAYIYIGDPALTIPVPLRTISASISGNSVTPGQIVRFKGSVALADSIHLRDTLPSDHYDLPKDPKYNGKIVVKLCKKGKLALSNDYISNTNKTGKELYVTFPDELLSEYHGNVKNGEFDFEITVPKSSDIIPGDSLLFRISAYDPEKDLAASGIISATASGFTLKKSFDTESPQIAVDYEEGNELLNILVSDNVCLSSDCLSVSIDGLPAKVNLTESFSEGNEYRYTIYTDNLKAGSHRVLLLAKDFAMNESEKSFKFVKKGGEPTINLTSDRKAATDEITFSIDNAPHGSYLITISDSEGNTVFEKTFDEDSYIWDCKQTSGERANAGLYKAMVKSINDNSSLFSSHVSFAIIE